MTFENLNLIAPLLKALEREGYAKPTPIQAQAIPVALTGRDLLGCAQTGTGKTAAFAIPILQLLHQEQTEQKEQRHASRKGRKNVRALVLTPTRELALQIGDSFAVYGKFTNLRCAIIFGGVGQQGQTRALDAGADILVATPGRLLDLLDQNLLTLDDISIFTLDEADRMLDMGFIQQVQRILELLPERRQTLFFSATMPQAIDELARNILHEPAKVEVTPVASTVEMISQSVYFVDKSNKAALLLHLLKTDAVRSTLVFTRTKHGADKVAKNVSRHGVKSEALHGNKSQTARQRALDGFKRGDVRVLVATDIAARGIDIDDLARVINFDLPEVPEAYVHRIGRTGRAGASGVALSFCDWSEKKLLRDIHALIRKQIPVVAEHPFPLGATPPPPEKSETAKPPKQSKPSKQAARAGGGASARPKPNSGDKTRNAERRPEENAHAHERHDPAPALRDNRRKWRGQRRRGN